MWESERPQPEKKFEFESPQFTVTVQLPKVAEQDYDFHKDRYVRKEVLLGMHTDMLKSFHDTLESLKPKTKEKLYIQGRILTDSQRRELYDNPMFEFFWSGRSYRTDERDQRMVLSYMLPANTKITEKDVRTYAHLNFAPDSLVDKIGYKVGWFNVEKLLKDPAYQDLGSNYLRELLGACNQFKIGADSISPGLLKLVQGRLVEGFWENKETRYSDGILVKNANWLRDSVLSGAAKVFKV